MNTALASAFSEAGISPNSFIDRTEERAKTVKSRAKEQFGVWTSLNQQVVDLKSRLSFCYKARKEAYAEHEEDARIHYACFVEMKEISEKVFLRAQAYIKPNEIAYFDNEEENRDVWLADVFDAEVSDDEIDIYRSCSEAIGGLGHDLNVSNKLIDKIEAEIEVLGEEILKKQVEANVINFKFGFARMNAWQLEQVEAHTTAIGRVVQALLG